MPMALGIQESCQPASGQLDGAFICSSVQPLQGCPPSPKVLGPRVVFTWVIFSRLALGFRAPGEKGWMLFRSNTKLVVERVVPDLGAEEKHSNEARQRRGSPRKGTGMST